MLQNVESAGDGIAQREHAERALARAMAATAALQRASLDGILLVDAAQHIISYNRLFADIWKIPDELLAAGADAPMLRAVSAQVADPDAFAARVKDLYAHIEETSRDEVKLRDGRTLDRYSAPVTLDDGTYLGRVWFFRDITAHKLADDTVREDASRFRALVEQQIAGIFIIRADGNLAYINGRFSALFGYTPAEVIGRPFIDLILESDRRTLLQAFDEHLLGGPLATQSVTAIKRKDGGVMNVLAHASLAAYQGKPALIGIVVDITERRRVEAELAYRDRVRHAINVALGTLVTAPSLTDGMPTALQTAAEALLVDRMFVLQKSSSPGVAEAVSVAYSWQAANVPTLDAHTLSSVPSSPELTAWIAPLSEGKPVTTDAASAPGAIGELMRRMRNISSLMVPITIAGELWGQIGVDDCKVARQWTPVEVDSLGTLSQGIGALVARERSQMALTNSEERFRAVSDTAQDAIVMIDSSGAVDYWNRAAERIFGYTKSEVLGKGVHQWLAPPRYRAKSNAAMPAFAATGRGGILGRTLEMAALRKGGVEFPIELSVTSMRLGAQWHAVATIRDITERNRILEQIRFSALHDNLTGLANRAVFVEALQQAIHRAQRDGEHFAVLYLDLDHFKDVNDTLGHPVGDLLLQALGDRLRSSIRGMDTVARFGGDEFALIQTHIPEPLDAAILAEKLLQSISAPFLIQGDEIRIGASVGIAVYGLDSPTAELLLSHADVALYRAKAEGRGTYRFFTDAMDVEVRTRVTLASDLRDALAGGQIFLMYQPQIDVDTGRFVGVEALARWQHPTRGLVPPSIFIPIAEQSGLIVALGNWVLRTASNQMREWMDAGIAPPLMAVNVSGLQFKTPFALENEIAAILVATGLAAPRLELELTESVLMEVSGAHNDALLRLRKAGHRIAIDDFGTGYSSLEYLGHFPVDRIKIAESFIVGLTATSGSAVVIRAAIGLAHELRLDVVVEGVENAAQLQLVRSWGCRKVQGYYYSAPLRARDLAPLLRAGKIIPQPLASAVATVA